MQLLVNEYGRESIPAIVLKVVIGLLGHSAIALGWWVVLMLFGYAINPSGVPQWAILTLSIAVPFFAGLRRQRKQHDELANMVWLVGLAWALCICLYVLGLPTGPNACFECDAADKLMRTFFSMPQPSGLLDNDGPFLGTWPVAALVGYSMGAEFANRREA